MMAASFYGSSFSGVGRGGAWNNRFKLLEGEGTNQDGGRLPKRVKHSTGGAGTELSSEQLSSMKLSMDKFKGLDSDTKLESIFECLQNIKFSNDNRLNNIEQSVRDLQDQSFHTQAQLKLLRYNAIDSEARCRRSNLIFRGIPEELGEDSFEVLKRFILEYLEIDPDEVYIHRAHRVGRLQTRIGRNLTPQQKHRPLIAAFRDFRDVDMIIDSAKKLKGLGFGINRDIPKELVEARKPLWARLKGEKAKYPNAKLVIAYPAKLIMNKTVIQDSIPDWHAIMNQSRFAQLVQFGSQDQSQNGGPPPPPHTPKANTSRTTDTPGPSLFASQNVASQATGIVSHMEVVSEAEEIQGDSSYSERADDDAMKSRGASTGDGDHDGSSVDPFSEDK